MDEIIEIILTVCDRIINTNIQPRNEKGKNFQLFAHFQVRTADRLITTVEDLLNLGNGEWRIIFTKCTRIDLRLPLFIDIDSRQLIAPTTNPVGSIENGNGVIAIGIDQNWIQGNILNVFGPGSYKIEINALNQALSVDINSNDEEIVINQPERMIERVAEAMDRNTAAMQGLNDRGVNIRLNRSALEPADEQQQLFDLLRERRPNFSTRTIRRPGADIVIPGFVGIMDDVLGAQQANFGIRQAFRGMNNDRRLDFPLVDSYEVLKFGTEAFLRSRSPFGQAPNNNRVPIPYYEVIMDRLRDFDELREERNVLNQENINTLLRIPCIELIWSYWMEQGMLVQSMNSISLRFQNISNYRGNDPLARLDIDPLRPLNNLLWGYIQDEQHTLSLKRRAYEYDHSYGLMLQGRAVPTFKSVDSRSKFLESFHNLLHSASIFYKERDDATRFADAFPLLNALREVHLLLAEGNHNSYGNLTWTARIEMMMQQYLLARPEMREFLGGRTMVPFQEPWMDRVDTMRQLQNWGSTSITYYHDLAELGELIILSIRLTNWSDINIQPNVAAVWADSFRNDIQRYIHSYRTVTGVDLSADAQLTEASFMQPSVLIQRRLQGEQRGPLRNSRIVGANQQR